MLRRFLLTSGLILGGAIAYSPKVVAQEVNVPFRANIDTACQVNFIEPGTLVQDSGMPGVLRADGPTVEGPGRVGLSCNTPAELTITGVTAISTPEPDPEGTVFLVYASGGATGSSFTTFDSTEGSEPPLELSGSSTDAENLVDVNLTVDRGVAGGSFSAGMYEYEVNMTVTPQ